MRMLMVILTLLFVYPLCPDEVQTTADAGIEVLECGFCEESSSCCHPELS